SNLVQAEFSYVSAVASYQQATASETKYNDMFDAPLARPSTLTLAEAAKAARARHDSPLDPGKPATTKAKRISPAPPEGKVETSNDYPAGGTFSRPGGVGRCSARLYPQGAR